MESVAETTDTEPKNLPALYDAIDPDALGTLCRCEDDSPGGAPVHISFSYAGSKVLVGSDGEIVVGLPRFEG